MPKLRYGSNWTIVISGGEKYWQWVKKGSFDRGDRTRDLENKSVFVGRRDQGGNRQGMDWKNWFKGYRKYWKIFRSSSRATLAFREEHTKTIDDKDELYAFFSDGSKEKRFMEDLPLFIGTGRQVGGATQKRPEGYRALHSGGLGGRRTCIFSGNPSPRRVVLAKSY